MISHHLMREADGLQALGSELKCQSPYWEKLLEVALSSHHLPPGAIGVSRDDAQKVIAVPVSGGLDSTVAYWMALATGCRVRAFYMGVDTCYRHHEEHALESLGICYEVHESSVTHRSRIFGHMIPARNLWILLRVAEELQAAGETGEIWLGAVEGEISATSGDKSLLFRDLLNQFLAVQWAECEVIYPFEKMTKRDLVLWAIQQGKGELVVCTRTCQESGEVHCGRCLQCAGRFAAFYETPLAEVLDWEGLGPWSETVHRKAAFVRQFLAGESSATRPMSLRWARQLDEAFGALGVQ